MSLLNWISKPVHSIRGEITVPGDKSISHRAIMLGSIAKGVTVINGFLDADDCMATLNAFQSMGITIEIRIQDPLAHSAGAFSSCLVRRENEQQVVIYGSGKHGLQKPDQVIDCGNSGTSMRLLAGLLSAQKFDSQLTGDESLLKRPMQRISTPLKLMGADISTQEGKPPILIKGGQELRGINYRMPEASAQVKSCILLAGLYAQGETKIIETGSSRDHTELMLKTFSYPIQRSKNCITINAVSECLATEIFIPGDISSAAFFMVAATIIPGSDILIRQVGINPTRTGIISILLDMGADITLLNQRQLGEEWIADLRVRYAPLTGINIPANKVPLAIDEFPAIFIAAACAQGQTVLHGAQELRFKESDRIAAVVDGLVALGIHSEAFDDGIFIEGGTLRGGTVDSRGDHRIAMSFAIAGSVASEPVLIKNCAHVATSFPSFIKTAKELQLQIEVEANHG